MTLQTAQLICGTIIPFSMIGVCALLDRVGIL